MEKQESNSLRKTTKRAAILGASVLLVSACGPIDKGGETPLSLVSLVAQSAKPFPAPVRKDEGRIRLLAATPRGSKQSFFSTAEKVSSGSASWELTAGHSVKGTDKYRFDCNKNLKVNVGSLAVRSAGTHYTVEEATSSANDVAVLSLKSKSAMKALPSIPLADTQPKTGDFVYTLGLTNETQRVYATAEVIGKLDDTILVAQPVTKAHIVEGNSGGAAVNVQGEQFAIIRGGGSEMLSATQINTTYGTDGVHVSGSGEYYVGQLEPITVDTLNDLASRPTCDFS